MLFRCFTQTEFEDALSTSTNRIVDINANIISSYDQPGFLLTPTDAAYAHFATHEIAEKAIDDEFTVQVVNDALSTLKNQYNLTKTQLRFCISHENISASSVCQPLTINCDPFTTK